MQPHVPGTGWVERYLGGSPENETALIARFQRDIQEVQDRNKAYAKAPAVLRALHAKVHLGVTNAEVRFHEQLPDYLRLVKGQTRSCLSAAASE